MGLVKRNKGNKYPRDPLVGTSMWRCLGLVQERESREIMGSQKMVMVLELVGRKKSEHTEELQPSQGNWTQAGTQKAPGHSQDAWGKWFSAGYGMSPPRMMQRANISVQATEEPLGSKLGQRMERAGGFSEKE